MTPGEPIPEYLRNHYRRLFAEWDREFAANALNGGAGE